MSALLPFLNSPTTHTTVSVRATRSATASSRIGEVVAAAAPGQLDRGGDDVGDRRRVGRRAGRSGRVGSRQHGPVRHRAECTLRVSRRVAR